MYGSESSQSRYCAARQFEIIWSTQFFLDSKFARKECFFLDKTIFNDHSSAAVRSIGQCDLIDVDKLTKYAAKKQISIEQSKYSIIMHWIDLHNNKNLTNLPRARTHSSFIHSYIHSSVLIINYQIRLIRSLHLSFSGYSVCIFCHFSHEQKRLYSRNSRTQNTKNYTRILNTGNTYCQCCTYRNIELWRQPKQAFRRNWTAKNRSWNKKAK